MVSPERYASLLVMNTALGTGDAPLGEGFLAWRTFSNRNPDMDIARLMQRACPHLREAESAAYAAPFPNASYKAGVRRFPNLVPDRPDAGGAALSRQARDFWRERWTGRSLMAIGMKDPVLGPPVMQALHAQIRNCPRPMEIAEGGHFLQEWGKEVAEAAARAL
jgi:haloalkane dehalogenase